MSVVLATAGYDKKICFWEAPSGRCHRMIKFSDSQVNRLEISPDKQFIAAAGNPVIRLVRALRVCIMWRTRFSRLEESIGKTYSNV